jgi:hypothetical protein
MLKRIILAARGWFSAEDREKDIKLLAFAAVVMAAIAWLSIELRRPMSDQWVNVFMWLCGLVGIGGAGWSAVENWNNNKKGPGEPK